MRRMLALLALFSMLITAFSFAPQAETTFALVGGMLLDGYEGPALQRAAVVIRGNRIAAVGPMDKVPIPAEARVIDTSGKTLLPGLIDAHVHLDLIGHGDYDRYYKFLRGMERLDEVMRIAAAHMLRAGVTSALDLGTPFQILQLRRRIEAGEIPGPRLTVSGPWITRVYIKGVPDDYQILIESPEEAAARTRELIQNGADVIKTWVGLTLEDYRAVVQTAHQQKVKVHAHLYTPEAIRDAIDAGVDVFQHAGSARNPPYDEDLVLEIAHKNIPVVQTIAHRIWIFPATVAFPERLYNPELALDMPADIYAEFIDSFKEFHRLSYFHEIGTEIRRAKAAAGQFIRASARMGVGTDAASPLNFHTEAIWREMAALVESGMTPLQVISAATKTNAEILGKFELLGTVEPGKLADILVVEGNPLSNIENLDRVVFVVKDGVPWYAPPAASEALRALGRPFR